MYKKQHTFTLNSYKELNICFVINIKKERWAKNGKRLDFEVDVERTFKASYSFKAYVMGIGLNDHAAKDIAGTIVDMIDSESYRRTKRDDYSFPMRSEYNATAIIYKKNFPTDEDSGE